MSDLESVLKGEETEIPETTEPAAADPAAPEQTPDTEEATGDDKPADELKDADESIEDATPAPETETDTEKPPEGFAPIKALQEERRKRQEFEQRLEAIEGQNSEGEKKDFWDDPEGRLQDMEQKFHQGILNERMNMSESFARKRWDDVDTKLETFKEMLQESPGLRDEMMRHASPWEFMAEQVERHERLKAFDTAENYRKELDSSFDKRVEEAAQKKAEAMVEERLKAAENLPGSAADARQAAGRNEGSSDADAAPPSLEEALGKH